MNSSEIAYQQIHTFVSKPDRPLKYSRSKSEYRRLPFIGGRDTPDETAHWNVPASGGYSGGCETGKAMALALLKSWRDAPEGTVPGVLPAIMQSFAARFEQEGGQEMARMPVPMQSGGFASLHGQCVGFFNTLQEFLQGAAKHLGHSLDNITEQDLVRTANAGLGFDEQAYKALMAAIEKEINHE